MTHWLKVRGSILNNLGGPDLISRMSLKAELRPAFLRAEILPASWSFSTCLPHSLSHGLWTCPAPSSHKQRRQFLSINLLIFIDYLFCLCGWTLTNTISITKILILHFVIGFLYWKCPFSSGLTDVKFYFSFLSQGFIRYFILLAHKVMTWFLTSSFYSISLFFSLYSLVIIGFTIFFLFLFLPLSFCFTSRQ